MRALVVDDSRTTRMLLSRMLNNHGIEAIQAENGLDGVEKIQNNPDVELVLLDWNMPIMNGYEFIKAVRIDKNSNDLAIIMVTTESEISQMVKALAAGANEYVMKPFTEEIIMEKIKLLGFGEG